MIGADEAECREGLRAMSEEKPPRAGDLARQPGGGPIGRAESRRPGSQSATRPALIRIMLGWPARADAPQRAPATIAGR